MKKVILFALMFLGVAALADTPVPNQDFWAQLALFVGGLKGASMLAIVVGVSQLVLGFSNSALGDIEGKFKLLIVSGTTVVGTVAGMVTTGMTWTAALFSGAGLAALQVFIHQLYTQFTDKPNGLILPKE